jgi:hypothetical protein
MKFRFVVALAATAAVAVGSFSSSSFVAAQDAPAPATKPAKKPPTDYRKLKELMPAELAGVKRSSNEGEKLSLGDFVITQARAEYAKAEAAETDPRVNIELFDYAGAPDMAQIVTAWQTMDVDRESDDGYERTTKVKDQPAYETYQNEGKSGQFQIWVGGRYYLNVQTTNLTPEQLKKLTESLPIDQLVALAKS